jgi:hypothetical protein
MLPIQNGLRFFRDERVDPIGLECRPLDPCLVLWLFFHGPRGRFFHICGYKPPQTLGTFPLVNPFVELLQLLLFFLNVFLELRPFLNPFLFVGFTLPALFLLTP